MPNRDGSGPFGDGRPGRGLGNCAKSDNSIRRGMGRGNRCGFGLQNRFRGGDVSDAPQSIYPYTEESLQSQKEELVNRLNWIEAQLGKK